MRGVLTAFVLFTACEPPIPLTVQNQASGNGKTDLRVTVIGCVERVPADGTPRSPLSEPYVLSKVTMAAQTGRSVPSESDLVTQAAKSYRLEDARKGLVAGHVGDRVEISGAIAIGPSKPTAGGTLSEAALAPRLRVDSLRTISSHSTVCRQEKESKSSIRMRSYGEHQLERRCRSASEFRTSLHGSWDSAAAAISTGQSTRGRFDSSRAR